MLHTERGVSGQSVRTVPNGLSQVMNGNKLPQGKFFLMHETLPAPTMVSYGRAQSHQDVWPYALSYIYTTSFGVAYTCRDFTLPCNTASLPRHWHHYRDSYHIYVPSTYLVTCPSPVILIKCQH